MSQPPAGGFGGPPPAPAYGAPSVMPQQPPPAKSGFPTWAIILVAVVLLVVFGIGIMTVLAIYGTRKYIANAKTAEARNSLAQMGKDAAAAYESESVPGGAHRICPSASAPVPRDEKMVSGRKYPSSPDEWHVDSAKNAGFACLKFEMVVPQYYQYRYDATPSGFTASARGDLNGNGVYSSFKLMGRAQNGALLVAPSILETNPEE